MEDYSLRYAAKSFRRWSPFTISNTALGGISFLALEAIGGSITLSYGFVNAFPAIIAVSILIFVTSLPIAYYSSRYNIDMDLLTRGAGFGYIGSTITSLIYAGFTFIFFALEAAIMAQALNLFLGLPIVVGYIVSSVVIIPITFLGIDQSASAHHAADLGGHAGRAIRLHFLEGAWRLRRLDRFCRSALRGAGLQCPLFRGGHRRAVLAGRADR
jgi:hypothetical protein